MDGSSVPLSTVSPSPLSVHVGRSYTAFAWEDCSATEPAELGTDELVMAGTSTSGCVRATVTDAAYRSFRVSVVEESCEGDLLLVAAGELAGGLRRVVALDPQFLDPAPRTRPLAPGADPAAGRPAVVRHRDGHAVFARMAHIDRDLPLIEMQSLSEVVQRATARQNDRAAAVRRS